MKKYARSLSIYMAIFLIIVFALYAFSTTIPKPTEEPFTYSDLLVKIASNEVKSLKVQGDSEIYGAGSATVVLKGQDAEVKDDKEETDKEKTDKEKENTRIVTVINTGNLDGFVINAIMSGVEIDYDTSLPAKTSWILSFVTPILIMILCIVVLFMFVQQMQGGGSGGNRVMSFGKSKAKAVTDDKKKVTFDHVAGLDEEKAELKEIVEFLKQPKKFVEIGARIPKGVLLVGPPGTGKTLLARAVSGEAGVPFFSISGSDFVEMFVGVGASRVRDLFEEGKKNSPCIIFIDEIDAVGRRRGAGLGGGHDEREQTLNQLLVEMDGFGVNEGVIVIAATNRDDILDPALLRPGRFDRRVVVGRPDAKGREEILIVHSKGKKMKDDVNLKVIAQSTAGFTGADLENLLNEAALLSARENKKEIDMDEIRKAFIKVGVGTEKKSRVVSPRERKLTAYHETGHAILHEALPELDPVHIISIIPTGFAGGYTMPLPGEDKSYLTRTNMNQQIMSLLGGRIAEEIVLKEISTGASNDIERATAIARNMVTKYGMSDKLGPIQFGDDSNEVFIGKDLAHARNYGEEIATTIDSEVRRIIGEAYTQATEVLTSKINILHASAHVLMEKEKITGDEFRKIYNGEVEGNFSEVDEKDYPTLKAVEFSKEDEKESSDKESSDKESSDKENKDKDISKDVKEVAENEKNDKGEIE